MARISAAHSYTRAHIEWFKWRNLSAHLFASAGHTVTQHLMCSTCVRALIRTIFSLKGGWMKSIFGHEMRNKKFAVVFLIWLFLVGRDVALLLTPFVRPDMAIGSVEIPPQKRFAWTVRYTSNSSFRSSHLLHSLHLKKKRTVLSLSLSFYDVFLFK